MNAITAMMMTQRGTQTPIAIFAPVERPSLDAPGDGVDVDVGMSYVASTFWMRKTGVPSNSAPPLLPLRPLLPLYAGADVVTHLLLSRVR